MKTVEKFKTINKTVAIEVCVSGVRTFAVELEAGQLGVDAHRDRPHLVERHRQRLLIAHRNLLVTFARGGHARRGVLARLVLDAQRMEKVQFGQKLKVTSKIHFKGKCDALTRIVYSRLTCYA